jgi:hypothetical protein
MKTFDEEYTPTTFETATAAWVSRCDWLGLPASKPSAAVCNGLYRIGVDDSFPLKDFETLIRESRMHPDMADHLRNNSQGADVRDWFGTFHQVPANCWSAVEKWNGTA